MVFVTVQVYLVLVVGVAGALGQYRLAHHPGGHYQPQYAAHGPVLAKGGEIFYTRFFKGN